MPRLTTQSDVTNPQRKGYDFRIDDFLLRAAIGPTQDRQMVIQSSDVGQENAVNVKQNAEDFTTNIGRVFSRNDFSGGSNLDKAHKTDTTAKDIKRFWDSEHIDVFNSDLGKAYNISLLNSTTNIRTFSDAANDDNYVAVVGTDIYVADEAVLYKSTNNGSSFSTVTTGITGGYTIKAIAAHGTSLYIVTSNGSASQIILYNGSSAATKLTAAIYDGIWSVKGHLVVSIGTALHDYDGVTTVASAMLTLPTGETWTDVADVGAVILATATDGRIYSIKDVAGTLTAKGQTEISGEIPTCVAEAQGIVFYGTKVNQTGAKKIGRLYRADIKVADDLYVLANNQLIKEWDIDSIDAAPRKIFVTRDSVYTGIKESASTSYLWRYYLPTAGIARYYKLGAGSLVQGINKVNEQFIATVNGSGLHQQSATAFESEGYLITSPADFFTAEAKQYVGVEVETETLTDNNTVDVFISNNLKAINDSNDSSWALELEQRSGAGGIETQMSRVARYVTAKIVLKSATTTSTPKLESIQIRALGRPELVVAQIPVNISDRVERPFRKPIRVKNLGEAIYQSLKSKEGTAVTLEIFDPAETIVGVVEKISYPIQSNPNLGSVTQYAILTVRGTRQTAFAAITSGDVYAVNAYGRMRFG